MIAPAVATGTLAAIALAVVLAMALGLLLPNLYRLVSRCPECGQLIPLPLEKQIDRGRDSSLA